MADQQPVAEEAVTVSHFFAASPRRVFEAWASLESLTLWMTPYPHARVATEVSVDFRVGGGFRFIMTGDDSTCEVWGEYLEIVPPSRLVFTWTGATTGDRVTRVTVQLRAHRGGTELTLTQERLPRRESTEGYLAGWGIMLSHLEHYLTQATASEHSP